MFPLDGEYVRLMQSFRTRFPRMFDHVDFFDIGIQEAWLPIVTDAVERLATLNEDIRVCQVKQKFGEVRFNYNGKLSSPGRVIVDEMIAKCNASCETCGSPGTRRLDSFVHVACDQCYANER